MMRKVYVCMMIAIVFLGFSMSSVEAASERDMVQFLERYCDDVNPIDDCGRYDDELEEAQLKARNFDRKLQNYAAAKRNVVIYHMLGEFNEIFETTRSIDEKLVAAFYYTHFANEPNTDSYNVSSIISELFNRSANNTRYTYEYTYEDSRYENTYSSNDEGELTSVRGRSSRTSVSGNDIEIDTDIIDLVIRAEDEDGRDITSSSKYRVVAKFDKNQDRTYAASNSGNEWRLRLSQDSSRNDELHIYLLCRSCNTGTRFSSRSVLDGWRVLDVQSYDVDTGYSSYGSYDSYDRYDRYDEDSDLSLYRLEYTYDINRNDTEIRVTTTVRNIGDDDIILDSLEYDIEVDGDRVSSRDIDIDHIRTDCDESSSRGERNIRVEEDDECEIIVDITLDIDDDDIEDEIVEIQVTLDADDDENSRNDEKTIRFRAD